jgi:RNase H-fold protein (predicted Holliday junction resolvase)
MGGRRMHKKISGTLIVFACYLVIFALPVAYAGDDQKCGKCGYELERKILKKLHLAIENQDELKASDSQIKKIKELKIALKKDLIQRKAEIELIGVDIQSKLCTDDINEKEINRLIDRKYELKKAKTRSLVQALIGMKKILKGEQEEQLKDIMRHGRRMQHRCY